MSIKSKMMGTTLMPVLAVVYDGRREALTSMISLTTVCATRSATVDTPSFLLPPDPFGISTCLTGGGKYDPDDIRFHS
ncbi:hypothetical protein BGV48_23735 [Burkholderia ubonensis]|nr:hypothetical protein BGV48_23735 [Burkholderia ubonensis]